MVAFLSELDVDGILLSPGYHYEKLAGRTTSSSATRSTRSSSASSALTRYPKISSTPLFLEFAAGLRDYPCTPWGNPTYTPKGWKGPCYLIEGKYYGSWTEFFGGVDWDYWESRQDPRCHNCKMHSGFEPSVVRSSARAARHADDGALAARGRAEQPARRPVLNVRGSGVGLLAPGPRGKRASPLRRPTRVCGAALTAAEVARRRPRSRCDAVREPASYAIVAPTRERPGCSRAVRHARAWA